MEVKDICVTLNIPSKKIVRKAEEYLRLCRVKCPMGLGTEEVAKPFACVELACQKYSLPFNKERAIRLSGGNDKIYQLAVSKMRSILNLK